MHDLRFANGDTMPQLGLGTWLSGPGETYNAVREAIAYGYRHIDCAQAYGNQVEVGRAIHDAVSAGIVQRRELWVTSKLWNNAHYPDQVRPTFERSLAELRLEYVDLYLLHWPVAQRAGEGDPPNANDLIPPNELPFTSTWIAMQWCVESGRARHIGVANFTPRKIDTLIDAGCINPEVNQVELHPYLQQPGLVDYCMARDIHVTAYSPLGSRGRPEHLKKVGEPIVLEDPTILSIAALHRVTAAQVIIAWAIQRGISTIPKSVHAQRIQENFDADKLQLTETDMGAINAMDINRRYNPGVAFTLPGGGYTYGWLWDT